MKEIHAYQNADGTYRLEMPTQIHNAGVTLNGKITVPRARITIECLEDLDSGDILNFTIEENN